MGGGWLIIPLTTELPAAVATTLMIIIYVVTKKFVSVQNFITFFTLNDDILSFVI